LVVPTACTIWGLRAVLSGGEFSALLVDDDDSFAVLLSLVSEFDGEPELASDVVVEPAASVLSLVVPVDAVALVLDVLLLSGLGSVSSAMTGPHCDFGFMTRSSGDRPECLSVWFRVKQGQVAGI
tara:strand:- start:62830 stop:63204 length:375 start_codon:yes stop_codon:yes gene_type:complete